MDDRGIVMELEGAWNLDGMGMLSCMRAVSGVSVCVLVFMIVLVLMVALV